MLTKKGQKRTEEIVRSFTVLDKEMFSGVSKKEVDTFNKILDKVAANLKNMPRTDLFFNYKKTTKTA